MSVNVDNDKKLMEFAFFFLNQGVQSKILVCYIQVAEIFASS